MKNFLTAIFLIFVPVAAFALNVCPATLDSTQPVPAGWHITYEDKLDQKVVSFAIATYNGNHTQGGGVVMPNGERISCEYFDNSNEHFIEITTDQTTIPLPSTQGTDWLTKGTGSQATGWCEDPVNNTPPSACPWG